MFFLSVIAATCPWDNSKCTSDGDDCYVRPFEPMTCADGLLPIQKRSSTQTYSCCAPDDLTSCNASKCNALDYYGNPKGCVVSQSRTDPFTCSDGYVPVLPTYDTSTGYTCCDQGFTGQQTLIKPANTWAEVVDGMLSGSAGDSNTAWGWGARLSAGSAARRARGRRATVHTRTRHTTRRSSLCDHANRSNTE